MTDSNSSALTNGIALQHASSLIDLAGINVGSLVGIINSTNIQAPVLGAPVLASSSTRVDATHANAVFTGTYGLYPDVTSKTINVALTASNPEYPSGTTFTWQHFFDNGDQAIQGIGNTVVTLNQFSSYIAVVSLTPSRTSGAEGWQTVQLTATYADNTTETKTNTGIGGNAVCNFSINASRKVVIQLQFIFSAGYGSNAGARGLMLGFFNAGSTTYPNGLYYRQSNTGFVDIDLVPTTSIMKVSGFVNSVLGGTDRTTNAVILDNIAAGLWPNGSRSLVIWAATSTTYDWSAQFVASGNIGPSGGLGIGTAWQPNINGWNYVQGAWSFNPTDIQIVTLHDRTNSRQYRITLQIGNSYNNNIVTIERLL